MKVIWTKQDRKDFERRAWNYVKGMNAPRHMRIMLRDALAKDFMEQARREVEEGGVVGGGVTEGDGKKMSDEGVVEDAPNPS